VATDFYAIPPCRLFDTRLTALPLLADVPRAIPIAGLCGVPVAAKAVAVNVTVLGSTGAGSLVLYPGDEGLPFISSLAFATGQLRSNNATLKLATDGTGTLGAVAAVQGLGQVHLMVDVTGFYQ